MTDWDLVKVAAALIVAVLLLRELFGPVDEDPPDFDDR